MVRTNGEMHRNQRKHGVRLPVEAAHAQVHRRERDWFAILAAVELDVVRFGQQLEACGHIAQGFSRGRLDEHGLVADLSMTAFDRQRKGCHLRRAVC